MNKYQEALEFHKQFKEVLVPKGMGSIACINFEARFDKSIKLLQELVDKFNDDAVDKAWMEGYLKCQEEYGL